MLGAKGLDMEPFGQRLRQMSWYAVPAAVTMLMVLLSAVPWHIPGINSMMPAFALINIYYWGIFRPGALPYGFLFVLGLLQDVLVGTPLGISPFVNVSCAIMLAARRRIFGRMLFGAVWFGFAVWSCAALLMQWGIAGMYAGRVLPLGAYALQWGATCLVYPLLHRLLTRIYRAITLP